MIRNILESLDECANSVLGLDSYNQFVDDAKSIVRTYPAIKTEDELSELIHLFLDFDVFLVNENDDSGTFLCDYRRNINRLNEILEDSSIRVVPLGSDYEIVYIHK